MLVQCVVVFFDLVCLIVLCSSFVLILVSFRCWCFDLIVKLCYLGWVFCLCCFSVCGAVLFGCVDTFCWLLGLLGYLF